MGITDTDRVFLRRAVDLAREARLAGDDAFGSVLVSADGEVLFADRNRVVTDSSPLLHPEFTIAQWAVGNLGVDERAGCTVYTSGEHCPMCAAAHGWAGLGRIVYASSAAQFADWMSEAELPASPISPVPVQHVVPGVRADGPDPDLSREVRALHLLRPAPEA